MLFANTLVMLCYRIRYTEKRKIQNKTEIFISSYLNTTLVTMLCLQTYCGRFTVSNVKKKKNDVTACIM